MLWYPFFSNHSIFPKLLPLCHCLKCFDFFFSVRLSLFLHRSAGYCTALPQLFGGRPKKPFCRHSNQLLSHLTVTCLPSPSAWRSERMMGRVPSGGTPIVMPNLCVIKDAVLILFTSKLSKSWSLR